MQLKVLEAAIKTIEVELGRVEFDVMTGADASSLVRVLAPLKHRVDAALLSASARAVEVNQHNVDGASSGAAWIAQVSGVSQKSARSHLMTQKHLRDLPDVAEALRSGEISLEMASAVTQGSEGDAAMGAELLDVARDGTVEMVHYKSRELRSLIADDGTRHERLRKSQYVRVSADPDSMIRGEFCLLPSVGMALFDTALKVQGRSGWETAEAWAGSVLRGAAGKNSKGAELVFHLDLIADASGALAMGDRCELKGVGPVPLAMAADVLEEASKTFVGTVSNKLAFFAAEDRRSSTAPLPEWVKRAIRLKAYDRCEAKQCTSPASDVDHTIARCNNGTNDLDNLKALCRPHHDAKTKKDAPWTAGGIYGKPRLKPKVLPSPVGGQLFVDTG